MSSKTKVYGWIALSECVERVEVSESSNVFTHVTYSDGSFGKWFSRDIYGDEVDALCAVRDKKEKELIESRSAMRVLKNQMRRINRRIAEAKERKPND